MTDIAADACLQAVAARQPYPLLFATISGAHLYGFPSPDSDFDLRGAHRLPLARVVGLDPGPETITVEEIVDGAEIDLVTHDVAKFFGLLLKRNGYVLEGCWARLKASFLLNCWTSPRHCMVAAPMSCPSSRR
jgi:predicted nucleotidyltransferase